VDEDGDGVNDGIARNTKLEFDFDLERNGLILNRKQFHNADGKKTYRYGMNRYIMKARV
jgi:hypothetical protein